MKALTGVTRNFSPAQVVGPAASGLLGLARALELAPLAIPTTFITLG